MPPLVIKLPRNRKAVAVIKLNSFRYSHFPLLNRSKFLPSAASASLKKLASVSQHSSISQADDVSSPYARVRSPPHAYDKVRPAEHPYAQVKAGSTSAAADNATSSNNEAPNRRDSDQSLSNEEEELPVICFFFFAHLREWVKGFIQKWVTFGHIFT